MSDDSDFVTRREFEAAQRYTDRAIGALERALNDRLARTDDELRRLGDAVKENLAQRAPANGIDLLVQRALDVMERRKNTSPILYMCMGGMASVIAYFAIRGHW